MWDSRIEDRDDKTGKWDSMMKGSDDRTEKWDSRIEEKVDRAEKWCGYLYIIIYTKNSYRVSI